MNSGVIYPLAHEPDHNSIQPNDISIYMFRQKMSINILGEEINEVARLSHLLHVIQHQ